MRAVGSFMGRTAIGEAWIVTHEPSKNEKECRGLSDAKRRNAGLPRNAKGSCLA